MADETTKIYTYEELIGMRPDQIQAIIRCKQEEWAKARQEKHFQVNQVLMLQEEIRKDTEVRIGERKKEPATGGY